MKKLICEKCKKQFFCYSSEIKNCWCFQIPLKIIDEDFKNCLCKDCLIVLTNSNELDSVDY